MHESSEGRHRSAGKDRRIYGHHGLDSPAVHSLARNSLAPEKRPLAIRLPGFRRTPQATGLLSARGAGSAAPFGDPVDVNGDVGKGCECRVTLGSRIDRDSSGVYDIFS